MNINQKSLAVLSSPYLFGISQVGAAMAALAPKNRRNPGDALHPYRVDQIVASKEPASDGQRSTRKLSPGSYCTSAIPVNRINRSDRRAAAKFARRNPTIKVA